jgi:hypothetical protein
MLGKEASNGADLEARQVVTGGMSGANIIEGWYLIGKVDSFRPVLRVCYEIGIIKGTQISSTLGYRYQDRRSIHEAKKFAQGKCFHSHYQMDFIGERLQMQLEN